MLPQRWNGHAHDYNFSFPPTKPQTHTYTHIYDGFFALPNGKRQQSDDSDGRERKAGEGAGGWCLMFNKSLATNYDVWKLPPTNPPFRDETRREKRKGGKRNPAPTSDVPHVGVWLEI